MSEIVERGEPAGLDFDRLYRDDFLRAVRLAHLLTGSNDAAEDIAQEAFLRVRTVRTEIRDPQAYLTTTVVRLCRNWQRGRRRRMAREQRRAVAVSALESSHGEVDHHEELLALVDRLPFRQRTVLVARYWLDLPEADIAVLVGCRPGTVKSLASRALDTLRQEFA
jgi:RNA polymerase sigma factor (sigma-70 family)